MIDVDQEGVILRQQRANGHATATHGPRILTALELDVLDLPEPQHVASIGAISLAAGSHTLLHGPPSTMKTLVVLRAVISTVLNGGRGLVYQGEGSLRSFRERARRITLGLGGSKLGDLLDRLVIVHGACSLESREIWHNVVTAQRADIVVVDPMAAYFRGDENSASDVSAFLRSLELAPSLGAALVLVHHSTKPDENGRVKERGSSAFKAWADTEIACTQGRDGTESVLTHPKEREGERLKPQIVTWTFGRAITAEVEQSALDATAAGLTAERTQRLLGILTAEADLTRTELRERLNVSSRVLTSVLDPLMRDGRVQQVPTTRAGSRGQRAVEVLRLADRSAGQELLSLSASDDRRGTHDA
jgi:hypothetical protein